MLVPAIIGVTGFLVFLISAPYWAVDEPGARRVLEAQGYTDIKTGGYDTFGCGFDVFATRFTARTAKGYPVTANVCKTAYVSKASWRLTIRQCHNDHPAEGRGLDAA